MLSEKKRKKRKCAINKPHEEGNEETSFGLKIMTKMGWKNGQGLGLNNQGSVKNINTVCNEEKKGLGLKTDKTGLTNENLINSYSKILEKLNSDKICDKTCTKSDPFTLADRLHYRRKHIKSKMNITSEFYDFKGLIV